jgi:hypothetical protein
MRALLPALVLSVMGVAGCSPAKPVTQPTPGWHLYTNSRYGYEIQYPDGYELWETGLEAERDGASIRIALKEYQAPVPVLDVQIQPRTPEEKFPKLGLQVPDMSASVDNALVNGMAAREVQYKWAAGDDLAIVQVYVRGVVFQYTAAAGTRDFHATEWWAILSTFRFMD